jgi:hypothetical protein
MVEEVTLITRE